MSRSGYVDDCDYDGHWPWIMHRGAVASAIRGKRGQALLREMLSSLDALPEKRLEAGTLVSHAGVCALGSVALSRGLDASSVDPEDPNAVAGLFGVAPALVREVAYINDEARFQFVDEHNTPEERFARVRSWIVANLRDMEKENA